MSELDVRNEVVRLIKLKEIPTHLLHKASPDSFHFVKVYNRKVKPIDGDVPLDANGLSHIYKHGNMYIHLSDSSLWSIQKVLFN